MKGHRGVNYDTCLIEVDQHTTLTDRELEIVSLVGEAYSNLEIGAVLGVTEKAIKWHLTNVYKKLAHKGVENRMTLMKYLCNCERGHE